MVPSSSASRKHKVLFGKAARATRRVCSGTEYEEGGGSDIQSSSRKLQENGFANSIKTGAVARRKLWRAEQQIHWYWADRRRASTPWSQTQDLVPPSLATSVRVDD